MSRRMERQRRRATRRVIGAIRRNVGLGRLGRRRLDGSWTSGRPFGRGEIVAEFHRLRRLNQPPIFVIQAVRGYEKSELLDHFRFTYKRGRGWKIAEDTDAKIDFFAIDPEPEAIFASIKDQLAARRVRMLRFPRFERIQAVLLEERRRAGIGSPTQASSVENDSAWLVTTGVGVVNVATDASIPVPPRSLVSLVAKGRRGLCRKLPLTKAGRWTKRFERTLPGPMESPDSQRRRIEMLREGLGTAIVEDLRHATRRPVAPVGEVAIFIDGYHRVERSSQPGLIADFAKQLGDSGARVMVVVACREQEQWSKLAKSQPDYEDFGSMEVSERIQIHHLQPLAWQDRMHSLVRHGVPAALAERLAELSMGVPLMLALLGGAFGEGGVEGLRYRSLLAALPPPRQGEDFEFDDAWFEQFSRTIVGDMVRELDRDLLLHLRAAATQRNFDRNLLAEVLGDRFAEPCFQELVRSEFVGTSRPSQLLEVDESYRVRSFVREVLAADKSEEISVIRWHRRAAEHFDQRMKSAVDQEAAFRFQTEALFHQLFFDHEAAKAMLFGRFETHLLASRTDRCEALLRVALDYDKTDPRWRATVLTHAGKMYMARDRYPLAQKRLREAKALVSLEDDDAWLAVAVSLALAKCYRLQELFDDARAEWAALRGRSRVHPVVEFQSTFSKSLEEKDRGHLAAARDLADESTLQLDRLLEARNAAGSEQAAEAFGLASLPRKRFHIARHEADLARRAGNYPLSEGKTDVAMTGYRAFPEDGVEGYAELNRAHLLRQEGDVRGSARLAQRLVEYFTAPDRDDLRGGAEALRCLAQARLWGGDPEQARSLLEELVNVDPRLCPRAKRFGLFGLGDLERLGGQLASARALYWRSEEECQKANHFEINYAQLGAVELDRIESPQRVPGELRQLLNQPGVAEHPLLVFHAALIGVRASGPDDFWLDTARAAIARIKRRRGTESWETMLLARTRTAVANGEEPPPLVFNLP